MERELLLYGIYWIGVHMVTAQTWAPNSDKRDIAKLQEFREIGMVRQGRQNDAVWEEVLGVEDW